MGGGEKSWYELKVELREGSALLVSRTWRIKKLTVGDMRDSSVPGKCSTGVVYTYVYTSYIHKNYKLSKGEDVGVYVYIIYL